MGDPDLSPGDRPHGLVILPPPEAEEATAPFLRRWAVLIATLAVGVVLILLIALLWSSGPSAPNPRSLPPASGARGG